MKKLNRITIYLILINVVMSACSSSPKEENRISPEPTKQIEIQTVTASLPEPTQESIQVSGKIDAKTPRLTNNSTSEEIREKMLFSSFVWETLELEGNFENSSLNPDDSVAYTLSYENHIWIDQDKFRFRSEGKQLGVDASPSLAILNGHILVSRAVSSVVDGYPSIPDATYIHSIDEYDLDTNTMELLTSGEARFPPMGIVLSGQLRAEIFSSSYAIQYPGEYQVLGLENIAGREALKVFYDDADRWGRFNVQHTLWIDTETGLVLKAWSDGTPDHFISAMEITRIAYNIPLEEEMFNVEDALPDLKLSEMESDTVEGQTIYVGNLQVADNKTSLDICYELPSNSDWMLFDITVNGEERINPDGYLIYVEPAGIFRSKGFRCTTCSFTNILEGGTLHFEIGQLFAPAREGEACSTSDMVTQALEEAGTPISFTCLEDQGQTRYEILSKPDTMTEEEAKIKVGDLLLQFRNESLPGPWVFDISLEDE